LVSYKKMEKMLIFYYLSISSVIIWSFALGS
jgi:hypothetical protein